MSLDYPRYWHRGRTLLLVTWLLATASYGSLFVGATFTGEGLSPTRLLLGLLFTQAALLAAALLTYADRLPSLVRWCEERPRQMWYASLALQGALLVLTALTMREWNDERLNIEQAVYLAQHGLRQWIADYETINRWLGPHHPPLLALLYGGFYGLVGPHLLAGRLFNIAFSLGAMWAAVRLVRRATDEPTAVLATFGWLIFPLWLFNGAAAIMEGPFLLVFLLTADAFVAFVQEPNARRSVKCGAWLTLAMLCRYNIVLLVPGVLALLALPPYRAILKKPAYWWWLGVPSLVLAPLAIAAASTGLLATQAANISWAFLLLRPGGVHYLLETLLPLWPLHIGAHAIPLAVLGLLALWAGERRNLILFALGGAYLFLVLLILPNPRYFLPAVPFLGVGAARVWQHLEQRNGGDTATWLGLAASAVVLMIVVIRGSLIDGYYPFY